MIGKQLKFFFFTIMFFPTLAFAAQPNWEIIPGESNITFTGTQNNSPVSGEFKQFNAVIKGDIDQLEKSSVMITIDTRSITTPLKDLEDTLKGPDWFNVNAFPTAIFKAKDFTKINPNTYQVKGNLTIRGITLPLDTIFVVDYYTNATARIKGSAVIKRTAYGVGSGEWGSTDEVKDEVRVDFMLAAKKKP